MSKAIKKVGNGGRTVELDDGSKWEIDPLHTIRTSLWLSGNRVETINSENPLHPNLLVNLTKVECVLAKSAS